MKKNAAAVFDKAPLPENTTLRYLNDGVPGFSKKKKGDMFVFYDMEGKLIKDTDTLIRIKSLVLPPAWQNVWVSPFANSHLQATGIDSKGRKQYKYHPEWSKKSSETKFSKLATFARVIPRLRTRIETQLKSRALTREKVIALVIDLMSKSYIRIGNTSYARDNGSYGLTTMRDRHVTFKGNTLKFVFKGKKGIMHDIELTDKRLARLVKSCRDIPGQELFQYYDHDGHRHVIDSGDVNSYLHEVCGHEFSAKDFRTWAGTLHAFKALTKLPVPQTHAEFKRNTLEVIKEVSHVLGNTPSVCRKYYIHPVLLETFSSGDLLKFYEQSLTLTKANIENKEEEIFVSFLDKMLKDNVFQS
jgi:DNA topoisomerase-1